MLTKTKLEASRSDDLYPFILKNYIVPVVDTFARTRISYYYNYIQKMRKLKKQEIDAWQNKKLRQLVIHAYENTEYYRNLFDRNSIKPYDIKTKSDLKYIPILTRKDIVENYESIIPKNIDMIRHLKNSSGGTTGIPLRYLVDINTWSFNAADRIINWERMGYNYGHRYLALGSTSLFINKKLPLKNWVYYKLKRKIGLSGVDMSNEICKNYIDLIHNKNVKFIYGYASCIFLLARYVIENQLKVDIHVCFPTSEILTDNYRETIEKAFNCKVLNTYGAFDGGIQSFEHTKGYHEIGYNTVVNLLDIDDNFMGEALLTDTLNFALPFINYKVGDTYKICNHLNNNHSFNGQIINEVVGRSSDIIRLDNGHVLTGPGFTILFRDLPIEKYSIEVISSNTILCKVKKLVDFSEKDEGLIIETISRHAGEGINIDIEYVEDFPLTRSGKRAYFFAR